MSENFENKIFWMAEKETIGLPEEFDNRIDDLLKELSQQRKIRKISLKAAVILAAALTLAISATAVAAVSLYQQRMEAMNREKLEKYVADIYKGGSADTKNRDYMDTEKERMAQLQQSYEAEGLFPERELKIIDEIDEYKGKGVAFLPKRSAFFLPEKEMTEEELLQIIDFNHKRDYSLTKINELISSGQMTLPEADVEEVIPTDRSVLGSEAVLEPTQELTVPYEGELEISVIQAGYADRIALSKTASGSVDAVQGYNGEIFLAGYDGIFTYSLGDQEAKQVMQPYEAPCQWEGCRAAALPDGRIVFCASTEYNEINLNGSQQVRRKPESTSFFYSVTAGK